MRKNIVTSASVVFALTSFTALPAFAVAITSYGDYALPGTTVAAQPDLAGIVIEDLFTPFTVRGAGENITGTIQNRVVRGADGTLRFVWRISPTSGTGDILAMRLIGYSGFALDANWRIDGLGTEAPDIARGSSFAGAVNFLFETNEVGIATDANGNPTTSRFFFLDTDATNYTMDGKFDLLCAGSGCVSQIYPTFAPSAVPVPAAIWLFGSGLLGLIGVARRKSISLD